MENQHRQIDGYRELTQPEIDAMNAIKAKAAEVEELIAHISSGGDGALAEPDRRWVAIATTQLQQGFMALTRAVAKPTTF